MTERKQISLLQRTTLMIIGGVIMTLLFSYGLNMLSRWAVNKYYLSADAVRVRNEALAEDLQRYVKQRNIASTDYDALNAWLSVGTQRELFVYEEDSVYEGGSVDGLQAPERELDEAELERRGYGTFTITFSNGERRTVIADESATMLKSNLRVVMIITSFLIFAATLLLYIRRITRNMETFSDDVAAVSSGTAENVDERRGFRELSGIARDVNHMHDVITERTRSAQEALEANRELITALSHDIRTPLTALMAYLELLDMDSENLTDTQSRYLARSVEKADRIHELTDELFRYFLVFSDAKPKTSIEQFDAQILLQQMLGEYAIELTEQGYHIRTATLQTPCRVYADAGLLMRVMDNLFSNVTKYGDPAEDVRLSANVSGDRLHVLISNAICTAHPHGVESNHIGLRTCAAIMKLMDGTISTEQTNDRFIVDLSLPIAPEAEE